MKMRLIDSGSIISGSWSTTQFPAGAYVGLQILITAQKAATAITEANVGRFRLNFRGKEIVNTLFSNMRKLSDCWVGKPDVVDGGSGNMSYYGCFIPFYHPELPNALHKAAGDTMQMTFDVFGVASCSTAQVYIYGVYDNLPELYIPSILDFSYTAAAGNQKISVELENISTIMLTQPASSDPDNIELLIDNELIYSGSYRVLRDFSNNVARIESTALEVVLFELVGKGQIIEALADKAEIVITGGSGAGYYVVQSLEFNGARTAQSVQVVREQHNSKLVQKAGRAGAAVAAAANPELLSAPVAQRIKQQQATAGGKLLAEQAAQAAGSDAG